MFGIRLHRGNRGMDGVEGVVVKQPLPAEVRSLEGIDLISREDRSDLLWGEN